MRVKIFLSPLLSLVFCLHLPPSAVPFILSQLHLLSPCYVAAVHRSASSGLILSHGCTCIAHTVGVANLGGRRKSGASHKTRPESQAPSLDCRHTRSPHLPLLYNFGQENVCLRLPPVAVPLTRRWETNCIGSIPVLHW